MQMRHISHWAVSALLFAAFAGFGAFVLEATSRPQTNAAGAPVGAPAGNVDNGKKLFASVGCNACHGDNAQGMTGTPTGGPKIGPPPMAYSAFVMQVREPAGRMIPFGAAEVPDAQLADIYAFLQSLGPAGGAASGGAANSASGVAGNADKGQRLYVSYGCYECHGREGQGSLQTGGVRIGPPPISLAEFTTYIRQPANQMPPYAAKAVPDAEVAEIYAFLQTRPMPASSRDIPLLNK
jgi:mono/diheme cytochrome c family protein